MNNERMKIKWVRYIVKLYLLKLWTTKLKRVTLDRPTNRQIRLAKFKEKSIKPGVEKELAAKSSKNPPIPQRNETRVLFVNSLIKKPKR